MLNLLRALCLILFAAFIGSGLDFADSHIPLLALVGGSASAYAGFTPLHSAVENGDIAEVNRLVANGADINAKITEGIFDGWTPLHFAAKEGDTEMGIALLELGANPSAETKDGAMPVHIAMGYNHNDTARAIFPSLY